MIFIKNIGKIYFNIDDKYYVDFGNNENYIVFIDDIAYFSDDKNEVETYMNKNKYGL